MSGWIVAGPQPRMWLVLGRQDSRASSHHNPSGTQMGLQVKRKTLRAAYLLPLPRPQVYSLRELHSHTWMDQIGRAHV